MSRAFGPLALSWRLEVVLDGMCDQPMQKRGADALVLPICLLTLRDTLPPSSLAGLMHSTQYSALVSSEIESMVLAETDAGESQQKNERSKGKGRNVAA